MSIKAADLTLNTVRSKDGADIVYYSTGTGPGLLVIHGAACHGLSHQDLALLLADRFTVHLLSRRQRGLSDNYPSSVLEMEAIRARRTSQLNERQDALTENQAKKTYNEDFKKAVLDTDLADIDLVLEKTGSIFVLGVSVGAILTLELSLLPNSVPSFQRIQKVIIFEPPLQFTDVDTGLDVQGTSKYEAEMAAGDLAGAMITAMNLVQLVPKWMPGLLLKVASHLMILSQPKSNGPDGNTSMTALAPILRFDFAIVEQTIGHSSRYKEMGRYKQVLLLGGNDSPVYAKVVTDTLENVIPATEKIRIPGVGHAVLCNRDFRGEPAKAVGYIKDFCGVPSS